jgi:hypothetical protein
MKEVVTVEITAQHANQKFVHRAKLDFI